MSKITEIKSARAGDMYYKIEHDSGLTIYLYPKSDYNSKYAIFGTRFGSVNNAFSLDGGEVKKVPDGIAHYLEHKMFECEDGDAFAKYAKTGANANAYTSFNKTCYLFSCTENFDESFDILLPSIFSPSRVISPSKFRYPIMHFIKVVLPAPFAPNSPMICPFGI